MKSKQLAVNIGLADRVAVDKQNFSHSGAGKRLAHKRSDAAETEYRDRLFREFFNAFLAYQQCLPFKNTHHLSFSFFSRTINRIGVPSSPKVCLI